MFLISGPLCRRTAVFFPRILILHAPWRHFHELTFFPFTAFTSPPETVMGEVGNRKVTSIRNLWYQRLDWEAGISCRWQQVSAKSRVTWSPVLRPETITRRLPHFVVYELWLQLCKPEIYFNFTTAQDFPVHNKFSNNAINHNLSSHSMLKITTLDTRH